MLADKHILVKLVIPLKIVLKPLLVAIHSKRENHYKPVRKPVRLYSARPKNKFKSASNFSPIPIKRKIPHSPGEVYSNNRFMPWGMGWG